MYVTYRTDPEWQITATGVAVGKALEDLPQSKAGNPKLGRFPYKAVHVPIVTEYTYTIPLAEAGYVAGDVVFVAAHAEVQLVDGDGTVVREEGAWRAGLEFSDRNWAMYFRYEVQGGPSYELVLDKTGPDPSEAGGIAEFFLAVHNVGRSTVTDVVVRDLIPPIDIAGVELPALAVNPDARADVLDEFLAVWHVDDIVFDAWTVVPVPTTVSPLVSGGSIVINVARADGAEADAVEAEALVSVVAPELRNDADEDIGTSGFWTLQIGFLQEGNGNARFTVMQLEGWLWQIRTFSRVFNELGRAGTLTDAGALLRSADPSAAIKLQRHLLTLWFNLASHQVLAEMRLCELIPADESEPPSPVDGNLTVAEVMVTVESELLSGADEDTLLQWKDVVDFINNSQAPSLP